MAKEGPREEMKGKIYVAGRRFDKELGRVVGKDISVYQLGAIEQMQKNNGKVSIQGRGMATSRAIDVAAILERKGIAKIKNVIIKSGSFDAEGRDKFVSEIEILMEA